MRKLAIMVITSIVIIIIVGLIAYQDPSARLLVKKIIGLQKAPEKSSSQLNIEEFVSGLSSPTTMTFVGDDILILEKYTGKVRIIKDGKQLPEPVFDFKVNGAYESGLLGIHSIDSDVYVYLTEAEEDGGTIIADNIYRLNWDGNILTSPELINSFTVYDTSHHGGIIISNEENKLFLIRGDQRTDSENPRPLGPLQNSLGGELDDTGVIIKIGIDKNKPTPALTDNPLEYYYAMGIRNSFGIAFDPITGNLWDTENGNEDFDEINLVPPNFNSGWEKIMGMANETQISELGEFEYFEYSNPEFVWEDPVAPTAIAFPGLKWGETYKDSVFVGSCIGDFYQFKLNSSRTGFEFATPNLQDLVLNYNDIDDEISILKNLGCVTDIKFGPDNAMYVVSFSTTAVIYKIVPNQE